MSDLETEFLFTIAAHVDWRNVIDLGVTPHGIRQVVYIKGGTFEGAKIKGVVLPGGGDWFARRADQLVEVDVRDTTVKHFDSTMTGAPTLANVAGNLLAVLDACLVDGFGLKTVDSLVVA